MKRVPLLSRMRKRDRLALGLAMAAAAVYLLASLVVIPRVRQYQENADLIAQEREALGGYLETLARERTLREQQTALKAGLETYARYMLAADKAPLAAAELQNRVKEAAASSGLEIISEKIGSPVKGEQYTQIPVEITANGTIGSLSAFLYAIETGSPLLTIPEITIRVNKKRTFDAVSKKYVDVEELQSVVLISGMMKGEI
jgi:Tfp pilus assembly protein PilO